MMTFLKGQDPTRIEYLLHYLMQQTRFPPGALGLSAISAIDHCLWISRPRRSACRSIACLAAMRRDRVKVYAGVYTAPDPEAARDEFDRLNAEWGPHRFKLSPYRVDMHRHRWGEVVRTSAEYFRRLRESVRSELRESPSTRHARSWSRRRRCSSAMRSAL